MTKANSKFTIVTKALNLIVVRDSQYAIEEETMFLGIPVKRRNLVVQGYKFFKDYELAKNLYDLEVKKSSRRVVVTTRIN